MDIVAQWILFLLYVYVVQTVLITFFMQ